jgi:hypothetical protein
MLEEETEVMLDDAGFVFAKDGKSYNMKCDESVRTAYPVCGTQTKKI